MFAPTELFHTLIRVYGMGNLLQRTDVGICPYRSITKRKPYKMCKIPVPP